MLAGGGKPATPAVGSPLDVFGNDHILVGASPLFQQVLHVADAVAANDCMVLLEGESGTGKELIARRIHDHSPRANGPFIPVNCPAISESLFESQFYGHVRGAFTGAENNTLGVVRSADSGTLMLDEIGELPLHMQPKLLRLLQEKEVTPVGDSHPIPVNTRFIAATNRSLEKRIAEGKFRSDLYHRLNIVRIEIPPLRSRPEDIDALLDFYLVYYAECYHMPERQLGLKLRQSIREYPWPGNVRELCAYIERLYAANLPPLPPGQMAWHSGHYSPVAPQDPAPGRMPKVDFTPVGITSLAKIEAHAILRALEHTGYNRSEAARLLDIHRTTLLRKMRLYGLDG